MITVHSDKVHTETHKRHLIVNQNNILATENNFEKDRGRMISVPEGYVEFSMRVMKRAKEISEQGIAPRPVAFSDSNGVAFWLNPDDAELYPDLNITNLIETAANALLMAMEK